MTIKKKLVLLLALVMLLSVCAGALAANTVTVTVKYVTGEKNSRIASSEKLKGIPGQYFQVDVKDIAGYTFIGFTHNSMNSFVFPEKDITLLCHYAKGGVSIKVKYVDQNGERIAESTSLSGSEGQTYTVPTPYIKGYTFMSVSDPNQGYFGAKNGSITVRYQYNGSNNVVPVASTVHLLVQSVNQNTGGILKLITTADVPYGTTVDLSSFDHRVDDNYIFSKVLVNGVPASSQKVRLTANTQIAYYYYSRENWTRPVTQDNTLTILAVDETNNRVIRVISNTNMPYGTSTALRAPNISGYGYDYYTVQGAVDHNGIIVVTGDACVTFYYYPLLLGSVN